MTGRDTIDCGKDTITKELTCHYFDKSNPCTPREPEFLTIKRENFTCRRLVNLILSWPFPNFHTFPLDFQFILIVISRSSSSYYSLHLWSNEQNKMDSIKSMLCCVIPGVSTFLILENEKFLFVYLIFFKGNIGLCSVKLGTTVRIQLSWLFHSIFLSNNEKPRPVFVTSKCKIISPVCIHSS